MYKHLRIIFFISIYLTFSIIFLNKITFAENQGASVPVIEKMRLVMLTPHNIYKYYCAVCHGEKGRGDGIFYTVDLTPKPTNFTDAEYMSTLSDEELYLAICQGSIALGKSNLSPPWCNMFGDRTIHRLVEYIRDLGEPGYKYDAQLEAIAPPMEKKTKTRISHIIRWTVLGFICCFLIVAAIYEWR